MTGQRPHEVPALEHLKSMIRGDRPCSSQQRVLGLALDEAAKGRIILTWLPSTETANWVGTVHGGYTAMALDEACCLVASSSAMWFAQMVTADICVDFFRPIFVGPRYRIQAEVSYGGRHRVVAQAFVLDDRGTRLAQARAAVAPFRVATPADRANGHLQRFSQGVS